jgi:hypothetical protein
MIYDAHRFTETRFQELFNTWLPYVDYNHLESILQNNYIDSSLTLAILRSPNFQMSNSCRNQLIELVDRLIYKIRKYTSMEVAEVFLNHFQSDFPVNTLNNYLKFVCEFEWGEPVIRAILNDPRIDPNIIFKKVWKKYPYILNLKTLLKDIRFFIKTRDNFENLKQSKNSSTLICISQEILLNDLFMYDYIIQKFSLPENIKSYIRSFIWKDPLLS